MLAKDVLEKLELEMGVNFPTTKGMDTMASMQAAARGEIDAAVLMGGNLLAANPDAKFAAKALCNIGFRLHLTTTLNETHMVVKEGQESLVLPVSARDEEWEPTTQESMFNYVRLSDGGIRRLENVRPESAILAQLAARVLPQSPIDFAAFGNHHNLRDAIAKTVPGMEQLKDIDVAREEFHIQNRVLHTPKFNTHDKRAHFVVRAAPAPATAPYMLSTVRSEGQFNSIVYEEADSYRRVDERWSVLMSADDIAALNIDVGARVNLRSSTGEMKNVRVFAFDLPRGSVMAYYPEANVLAATDVDPRSKTPAFKSIEIWISPA